ncbi:MAG: hypothetical protein IID46_02475 [Planctomycetes bacterium]|nr:hypothetical protein [Planctomycetota bacterium]
MNNITEKPVLRAMINYLAIPICAAFIGGAVSFINAVYFTLPWMELGWRRPVQDWLVDIGLGSVAGYWGIVWLFLPEWILAGILGVCIGLCLREKWLIAAISCAFAFISATDLIIYFSGEDDPTSWFSADVSMTILLWRMPSFFILAAAAYMFSGSREDR